MADISVSDKLVDNKLLTVAGRVGMVVTLMLAPFLITYLIGLGNSVNNIEVRVSTMEATQKINTDNNARTNNQLSDTIEELRKQNVQILQAVARLEARMDIVARAAASNP